MDRRLCPSSGRVAHVSLAGLTDLPLTEGELGTIILPLADLLANPGGARDRQLVFGAPVIVIDNQAHHAFIMAQRDGYCGWVAETAIGKGQGATHHVSSPATHLYPAPCVQTPPISPLYLNARLQLIDDDGKWSKTPDGFVPSCHLSALECPADPVTVAISLLHAPYLWGGNSIAGVDCSGLVQLAFHAAGYQLPADSDLQQSAGRDVLAGSERRGDLIFWGGHVAVMTSPNRIIHANGHSMSVAFEGLSDAIDRIASEGGGPVIARKRLLP